MTLPDRLVKLRKAAGLSQEEVADKLEVTRQTVSKWETGQSSPDLDKVLPLCSLYNVTPDELLHEGGSEEADEIKAQQDAARAEELLEKSVAKKKLVGILAGVFLYFIAMAFMMVAVTVVRLNVIVSAAIFLLLICLATIIIIYSAIAYRKNSNNSNKEQKGESKEQKIESKEKKISGSINGILALVTLAAYLLISFMTGAWYITWMMWIIFAILTRIVALIFLIRAGKDVDDED